MSSKPGPLRTVRTLWGLRRSMRLFWRLFHDARVPSVLKAVPLAGLVYAVSPLDFDFIPILGQMDDVAVVLLLARVFVQMCPRNLVREHEQALKKPGASSSATKSF